MSSEDGEKRPLSKYNNYKKKIIPISEKTKNFVGIFDRIFFSSIECVHCSHI